MKSTLPMIALAILAGCVPSKLNSTIIVYDESTSTPVFWTQFAWGYRIAGREIQTLTYGGDWITGYTIPEGMDFRVEILEPGVAK